MWVAPGAAGGSWARPRVVPQVPQVQQVQQAVPQEGTQAAVAKTLPLLSPAPSPTAASPKLPSPKAAAVAAAAEAWQFGPPMRGEPAEEAALAAAAEAPTAAATELISSMHHSMHRL